MISTDVIDAFRAAMHEAGIPSPDVIEADGLLQVLAGQDLEQMGLPPQIDRLRKLARPRQANALRHWLKQQHGAIGSEAQLRALLDVIAARATRGHHIHIRVGQGYVEDAGPHLVWIADPRG